jgi:hypothetical protein
MRKATAILFVFTVVGLSVGLWSLLPFLRNEHRRLETWKSLALWFGNGLSLAWFLQFCYVHGVLGRSGRGPKSGAGGLDRMWWLALVTVGAAIGSDMGLLIVERRDRVAAYERAEVVPASGRDVRCLKDPERGDKYFFTGAFQDRLGNPHEVRFALIDFPKKAARPGFREGLPANVAATLRAGGGAFGFEVAYDPEFPDRCWIAKMGPDGDDDLQWMLWPLLLYQTSIVLVFMLVLVDSGKADGYYPWWYDLHKALPVLATAAWAFFEGTKNLFTPRWG